MARQWSITKHPGGKIFYTHESDLEGSRLQPMTKWIDLGGAIGAISLVLAFLAFMVWMLIFHVVLMVFLTPFLVMFWYFHREEMKEKHQTER